MSWPSAAEYGEAIQNLLLTFDDSDIRAGQPSLDLFGLPKPRVGNFSAVFEVRSQVADQKWAVKCFTKHKSGLQERYREIDLHLQQHPLPFMVGFRYVPDGVLVRGQRYAFLKMDWVEGLRLDEFLADILGKPNCGTMLQTLCEMWVRLALWLRKADVAHGDLQHGNVLLVPVSDGKALDLKLIDYDGMFVPALASAASGEVGHPAYQHPERMTQGGYNLESDRFSHLLVYTTLQCLISGGRALWDRYYNGDRLLIGPQDLAAPEHSAVFRELWQLPDPHARQLVGHLVCAAKAPLAQVPLLGQLVVDSKVVPLSEARLRQVERWLGAAPSHRRADEAVPQVESQPVFQRATGTDDRCPAVAPASRPNVAAAPGRERLPADAPRAPQPGLEQSILEAIKSGDVPADYYQLLALPRFHRNRDDLLRAVQDCNRALHRLQNHPDREVAKQVLQLQRQVAEALQTFSDDGRWQDYDTLLIGQLGDQFAERFGRDAARWRRESLRRWLATRAVPAEQIEDVVERILATRSVRVPAEPAPAPAKSKGFREAAFPSHQRSAPAEPAPSASPAQSARDSSGQIPLTPADVAATRPPVPRQSRRDSSGQPVSAPPAAAAPRTGPAAGRKKTAPAAADPVDLRHRRTATAGPRRATATGTAQPSAPVHSASPVAVPPTRPAGVPALVWVVVAGVLVAVVLGAVGCWLILPRLLPRTSPAPNGAPAQVPSGPLPGTALPAQTQPPGAVSEVPSDPLVAIPGDGENGSSNDSAKEDPRLGFDSVEPNSIAGTLVVGAASRKPQNANSPSARAAGPWGLAAVPAGAGSLNRIGGET